MSLVRSTGQNNLPTFLCSVDLLKVKILQQQLLLYGPQQGLWRNPASEEAGAGAAPDLWGKRGLTRAMKNVNYCVSRSLRNLTGASRGPTKTTSISQKCYLISSTTSSGYLVHKTFSVFTPVTTITRFSNRDQVLDWKKILKNNPIIFLVIIWYHYLLSLAI